MYKKIKNVISQGNNIVYIAAIGVSALCILFSFRQFKFRQVETILQGLGCSGIAASLMAIFIDNLQRQKQDKKISEYRQALLSDLNQELKQCLERIIWFDDAISKLDMEKDIEYYLSLDFDKEAYFLNLYQVMDWDTAEKRVNEILRKYDEKKQDTPVDEELALKISKMFKIIGIASRRIQSQLDKLYDERIFIISSGIMDEGEILDIYYSLNNMVSFLELSKTIYATPIIFILGAYKKVRKLCNYENEFYVCWHPQKDITEMVIEDRRKKETARKG